MKTSETKKICHGKGLNISVGRNNSQLSRSPRRETQQRRSQQRSFRGFGDRNDTFYQTDASLFDQPSAFRTERTGFL